MCNCSDANKSGKEKSDANCNGSNSPCKKPPCPDGCSKVPKIKAKQASYVVVLDKSGQLFTGYPILEFEISDGCPNHLIDVQVAKKDAALLSGGPGIANSWDKAKLPKDRITQNAFSSWTNGDTSIKLDGAGKATYKMPLEWWQDLARLPRKDFATMKIHFRVIAFCDAKTAPENGAVSSVDVINNLTDFKVVDNGYIGGGAAKSVRMEFTVREANTTEMYTMVQWKIGYTRVWGGGRTYTTVKDYNVTHDANIPEWAIDRLGTNPRYHDGNFTVSADGKTASTSDAASSSLQLPDTHNFKTRDFQTRLHLNTDVAASVTISRQEGAPPVYGVVIGILVPEALTLDSANWNTRVLQVWDASGNIVITHPNTFAGPTP